MNKYDILVGMTIRVRGLDYRASQEIVKNATVRLPNRGGLVRMNNPGCSYCIRLCKHE